ncbi:helix-turn-helix domain-containing protein [Pseudomonas putida]|uniref:helix-turn-helix domain-containing protein n=1 Tax=Pseudomonas putida TaxID=303 RepID=UPI0037CBE89E
MSLKSSFAIVLRALRSKRNISQRDFGDTSRTFLSRLEGARASITLDKFEQVSQRLQLSPLTILTITLSEQSGRPAADLIDSLRCEIEHLQGDGGLPGLEVVADGRLSSRLQPSFAASAKQTEIRSPVL